MRNNPFAGRSFTKQGGMHLPGRGVVGSTFSGTAYQNVVMADAPDVYWPLSEAVGASSFVDVANGLNLTKVGTLTSGGTALVTGGKSVTGWGTSNYLRSTSTDPKLYPVDTFSVEFWLKVGATAPSGLASALYGFLANNNLFNLINKTGGFYSFDGLNVSLGTLALASNTTYHIVITCSPGNGFVVYLNGTSVATGAAVSNAPQDTSSGTIVGNHTVTSRPLPSDYALSDMAIYHTELTAARVSAHYAAR